MQLTLFGGEADIVAGALRGLDITSLTPLEALNKLEELKSLITGETGGGKKSPVRLG